MVGEVFDLIAFDSDCTVIGGGAQLGYFINKNVPSK
jgi:hypothetical protein